MYDFLSDDWVAAAREIRERHADRVPELPIAVRINQVITDAPFADGDILSYIDTSEGQLELELGALDEPDATITTSYDLARALIMGGEPQELMQAFLDGRIKIQGDMTRILALQTSLAATSGDAAANEVATEIQTITN